MTVHHHGHPSTVVRDPEGPANALIAVLAILLVAFLIWFFAFSGVVFNRRSVPSQGPANQPAQTSPSGGVPSPAST